MTIEERLNRIESILIAPFIDIQGVKYRKEFIVQYYPNIVFSSHYPAVPGIHIEYNRERLDHTYDTEEARDEDFARIDKELNNE